MLVDFPAWWVKFDSQPFVKNNNNNKHFRENNQWRRGVLWPNAKQRTITILKLIIFLDQNIPKCSIPLKPQQLNTFYLFKVAFNVVEHPRNKFVPVIVYALAATADEFVTVVRADTGDSFQRTPFFCSKQREKYLFHILDIHILQFPTCKNAHFPFLYGIGSVVLVLLIRKTYRDVARRY